MRLCSKVGKAVGDEELAGRMRKSVQPNRKMEGQLCVLVKSHKEAGQVTFHAVHSPPRYLFAGMAAWVISILRSRLLALPHILRDAGGLIGDLQGMQGSATHR